jgi:hypothetical protein
MTATFLRTCRTSPGEVWQFIEFALAATMPALAWSLRPARPIAEQITQSAAPALAALTARHWSQSSVLFTRSACEFVTATVSWP